MIFTFVLIGRSDMITLVLVLRHSIEKRSIYFLILTDMKPRLLTSFGSVNVGELTETKPAATRRINITIHCNRRTGRHHLKNLANLLVQLEVGYRAPVLGGCCEKRRRINRQSHNLSTCSKSTLMSMPPNTKLSKQQRNLSVITKITSSFDC